MNSRIVINLTNEYQPEFKPCLFAFKQTPSSCESTPAVKEECKLIEVESVSTNCASSIADS